MATVRIPSSVAARMTRMAISLRFATSSFFPATSDECRGDFAVETVPAVLAAECAAPPRGVGVIKFALCYRERPQRTQRRSVGLVAARSHIIRAASHDLNSWLSRFCAAPQVLRTAD